MNGLEPSCDSPPPPVQGTWKKADMLEGNVLVKKYRGGRQEDFWKKGVALLWDLPLEFIYFKLQTLMLNIFKIIFMYLHIY